MGRSEVSGAAVVCHACNGGGTSTFPDNPPFKGPKILDGVKIVFRTNPSGHPLGQHRPGRGELPEVAPGPEVRQQARRRTTTRRPRRSSTSSGLPWRTADIVIKTKKSSQNLAINPIRRSCEGRIPHPRHRNAPGRRSRPQALQPSFRLGQPSTPGDNQPREASCQLQRDVQLHASDPGAMTTAKTRSRS